jgi:hypothetical protein
MADDMLLLLFFPSRDFNEEFREKCRVLCHPFDDEWMSHSKSFSFTSTSLELGSNEKEIKKIRKEKREFIDFLRVPPHFQSYYG